MGNVQNTTNISFKRILSNNFYVLNLIHKAVPGFFSIAVLQTVLSSLAAFISSAYLLRYALNGINNNKSFEEIAFLLLVWLCIQLILNFFVSWYNGHYFRVSLLKVQKYINHMLFSKSGNVELECYENPTYYDSFVKALDASERRSHDVLDSFTGLLGSFVGVGANLGLLVAIDVKLLIFLIFPLLTIPLNIIQNKKGFEKDMKIRELSRRRDYAKRTFYLADYAKEMRLTNISDLMLNRFQTFGKEVIDTIKTYGFTLATLNFLIGLCNEFIAKFGATIYACYATLSLGSMGYGDCIVVINSIENVAHTLYDSSWRIIRFQQNALFIENLRSFMDHEIKLCDGNTPVSQEGDLVLNNVSFKYANASDYTLKNINIRLGKKEKIAIVGHNGAGKTTLVKLLLRLYDCEGSITFNDIDIKNFPLMNYRDIFSVVMQDYHVYALPIKDNVLLRTASDNDKAIVEEALKKSDLYDKISKLPNQENTVMTLEFDENGVQFSGGEQQKLAISHVYSKKNNFVILDEPSSALDPIAEYEMYKRMYDACKDCGMIFISHRLSSAVLADRIYLLENGTVAEVGTHKELMEKNGIYAQMFKHQAENYKSIEKEV